jgi:hypothetical protein
MVCKLVPQNVQRYSRGVAITEVVITEFNCIKILVFPTISLQHIPASKQPHSGQNYNIKIQGLFIKIIEIWFGAVLSKGKGKGRHKLVIKARTQPFFKHETEHCEAHAVMCRCAAMMSSAL